MSRSKRATPVRSAVDPEAPHAANSDPDLRAPSAWLMMLEGRAPWEFAALLAATPWLRRLPPGDGHPVMVFPGMGANDYTTAPLRSFLDGLGYATQPWGQGFNFGPRDGVLKRCAADVRALAERHGRSAHRAMTSRCSRCSACCSSRCRA